MLYKGVFERLARLRADGHVIGIASNQIAVAHGIISLEDAEELVLNWIEKIGGVSTWRVSPYDPKAKIWLNGEANLFARDDPSHSRTRE